MHMRNLECAVVVFAKLRGYSWKLRGVFCCVGAVCALVALSVSSSLSLFSAFVHFGDFCRGDCCGGAWFDDVGRSGGLPTEGLRGNPLTIP